MSKNKYGTCALCKQENVELRQSHIIPKGVFSHCLQNKQSVKFSINSAFFIEMCYNKCKKIIKSNKKACT